MSKTEDTPKKICPKCLRAYMSAHGCYGTETESPVIFTDNVIDSEASGLPPQGGKDETVKK